MTRGEALKDFFRKTILPVASAALLYCIFRSACVKNGELDYLWLWILCGLPFGIWRLAALDHTGRRLSGRRDRPVPSELRLCRPYRRLRPCLAAAGGGVVHPGHGVPPADGRQVFLPPGGVGSAPWKCGKRPLCRWKTHSRPDGKAAAFPTARKHRFPQHRPAWPFAHNPTAPTTAAAAKIAFPDRKNHHFMVEWG